ncbi:MULTISPECIES: MFS transporter [Paraburkholderia]|uniref:MFS transporter n=2 Tax=Paraburkholderia TaxID=1822464 RepID=A0A7Y6JVE2_9BURK|nr:MULTISPECIES: MFS transporter [Paraburkholderia]MBB5399480.1 putative MFS transporter [Paraburkholderia youngii]MBB5415726.1 putative MFS transporter [Paraburkholderia atlantica]MBB5422543.1 putative MFS transporter [Paraburkholderia atlantica]NUX99436.1 MFS transporter [Paraburkholderia youngii]
MNSVNAGARLDRLSIGPFHRRVLWLVSMGVFFDSFDNTLSSSVLAALLKSGWSTLELNSLFMSVTFAGLTIGAAGAGWLSDRFGRRFAYQFNLLIFGCMAVASAFAPSMHWMIVMRGIMALGMGAEYVMGWGLITEFVPPPQRGRYLGWFGLFAGIGVFVTSVIGWLIIPKFGWRPMFLIGGIGTLWVWWERRKLPESPRWLERIGRGGEAEAIMQRIESEAQLFEPLRPFVIVPQPEPKYIPVAVLFSRPMIRRTALAIMIMVVGLFGSYTLSGWMPTFFVQQGMSVTRSLGFNAAMMGGWIAGPLICAGIADRIGRRWGLVLFGLVCAGFGAAYPFLNSDELIVLGGFLLVSAVASFLILASGCSPELFPTECRFRGAGLAQSIGRAGLIVSPAIVLTLFNNYGIGGVIGALAAGYVAVALIMTLAGVETNQRSLEALDPSAVPEPSSDAILSPIRHK